MYLMSQNCTAKGILYPNLTSYKYFKINVKLEIQFKKGSIYQLPYGLGMEYINRYKCQLVNLGYIVRMVSFHLKKKKNQALKNIQVLFIENPKIQNG